MGNVQGHVNDGHVVRPYKRRDRGSSAKPGSTEAAKAASQPAPVQPDALEPVMSFPAQMITNALNRLFSGHLDTAQGHQAVAESIVACRRMSRMLLETASVMTSRGYDKGYSEDMAHQTSFSAEEAMDCLAEARSSQFLSDGPGLVPHYEESFAHDKIGGQGWYDKQIEAGTAEWDDIREAAANWLNRRCKDDRFEASAKTLDGFGLMLKALAEDAAAYARRSADLKEAWR